MKKLSEVIPHGQYAVCCNCKSVLIDDIPTVGNIGCPTENCKKLGFILWRGFDKGARKYPVSRIGFADGTYALVTEPQEKIIKVKGE